MVLLSGVGLGLESGYDWTPRAVPAGRRLIGRLLGALADLQRTVFQRTDETGKRQGPDSKNQLMRPV